MRKKRLYQSLAMILALLIAFTSVPFGGAKVYADEAISEDQDTAPAKEMVDDDPVVSDETSQFDELGDISEPKLEISEDGFVESGRSGVQKPTMKELAQMYKDIGSCSTIYAQAPKLDPGDYHISVLSNEAIAVTQNIINYYRNTAGLGNITLTDEANTEAAYGALVMAMGKNFSHYPAQPEGMSDADYQRGKNATSSSNISWSWGYGLSDGSLWLTVSGQMADRSSASNVSCLGHRRWLLHPGTATMGIGVADVDNEIYSDVKVFGDAVVRENKTDYDYISWPASGNNLTDTFTADTPWSVTLNPSRFGAPSRDSISIDVKRLGDGKQWHFDKDTSNADSVAQNSGADYFEVDNNGYGISNCIIFRLGDHSLTNDTYEVTVSGLKDRSGNSVSLSYKVVFKDCESALKGDVQNDIPVDSVSFDNNELKLKVGDTTEINATVMPENVTDPSLTWESDDETVVKVTGEGKKALIEALSPGKTTIRATSSNGKYDECEVEVQTTEKTASDYVSDLKLRVDNEADPSKLIASFNAVDGKVYSVLVYSIKNGKEYLRFSYIPENLGNGKYACDVSSSINEPSAMQLAFKVKVNDSYDQDITGDKNGMISELSEVFRYDRPQIVMPKLIDIKWDSDNGILSWEYPEDPLKDEIGSVGISWDTGSGRYYTPCEYPTKSIDLYDTWKGSIEDKKYPDSTFYISVMPKNPFKYACISFTWNGNGNNDSRTYITKEGNMFAYFDKAFWGCGRFLGPVIL